MGQRARVAASAKRSPDVPEEMIYLPPNGVNVYYAKTENMQAVERAVNHAVASAGPEGPGASPAPLMHPRAYITHKAYRFLVWSLVFCEWTDEEQRTRYYGFAAEDAAEIVERKSSESVKDQDATLIVPLSQRTDQKGSFYEQLQGARRRSLRAQASLGNRKARGDVMAPFLAFFASVARHDDPVATETLLPIECIARAALVAHEHNEEKRRKAMALLANQNAALIDRSMTTMFMEMICDILVLVLVFGNEAYDFIVYFVARMIGTGTGRVIGDVLGSNSVACFAYVFIDVAVVLVTMFAPLLLVGIPTTFFAVAASSAVSEAKAKCAGSSAARFIQWLIGALGNSMVRIVTGLLRDVDFTKDVEQIVEAARTTVSNVLGDVALGMAFQFVDERIAKYFKSKKMNKFVACLARVMIHIGVAKVVIEPTNAMYGKAYFRMLVPRWMNIAAIGVGNTRAERNEELVKKADEVADKEAELETVKGALAKAEEGLKAAEQAASSAQTELAEKDRAVQDAKEEMQGWVNANEEVKRQSGFKKETLIDNIDRAYTARRSAQEAFDTLNTSVITKTAEKSEAETNVGNLRKEISEAKEAKEYKEKRTEASTKAQQAASKVQEKRSALENAKSELKKAQTPQTAQQEQGKKADPADQETIERLKKTVAKEETELADALLKLSHTDEQDHYMEAKKRRPNEVKKAKQKASQKREQAAELRRPHEPSKPDGSVNGTENNTNKESESTREADFANATALEAEAAEIEREYEVNPSASSEFFNWMANTWNYWKPSEPGGSGNKPSMGSYV